VLGCGCLRFPKKLGVTDIQRTEPIILKAVEGGVNYFDTGYFYFGSEEALGVILERNHLRDKVHVADKFPLFLSKGPEDFDRIFNKQLERFRSDYIDYYLIHQLPDMQSWNTLCSWGIEDWIRRKKASGQIRAMGFSFHGMRDEFLKLLDAWDWDFCQIQYNYSDPNFQAGVTGLKKAASKGLSVIVMEPLLGGKLVQGLPEEARRVIEAARPGLSPAEFGLDWLWNQEEVTMTLSGMGSVEQVEGNLAAAEKARPGMLSDQDAAAYEAVRQVFRKTYKVLCTGCNYCMPCPHHVNIPACFASYNLSYTMGYFTGLQNYIFSNVYANSKEFGVATLCKKCGACEKKCSQHIPIMKTLDDVKKRLDPPWLRIPLWIAGLFINKNEANRKIRQSYE
jgi:predicted aldo/keto reductase-like oxidoreductase